MNSGFCEPSCPDCGAVDCDRAVSSHYKCSSSFHPGFQKVCDLCGRMGCTCETAGIRHHPDWVTCPACQCDMAEVLSEHPDPDQIKHLAMGYCSAECFERSK